MAVNSFNVIRTRRLISSARRLAGKSQEHINQKAQDEQVLKQAIVVEGETGEPDRPARPFLGRLLRARLGVHGDRVK